MGVIVVTVTELAFNNSTVGDTDGVVRVGTRRLTKRSWPAVGAVNVPLVTVSPLVALPTCVTGLEKAMVPRYGEAARPRSRPRW